MNEAGRMHRNDIFVDGAFVPAETGVRIDVVNPATEEVIGSVPDCGAADADRAVASARKAFASWRGTTGAERAEVLNRIADGIVARADEIKDLLLVENGSPKWWREQDVTIASLIYRQAAMAAAHHKQEEIVEGLGLKTLLRHEPLGVIAAIVPWNAPQALQSMKVANAIAAGCTAVVKPSPETTLDTYVLGEIMNEAGLPGGVVNIVPGAAGAGAAVVAHPGTDKISFTGSTQSGKIVAGECAKTLKPLIAELGGKSAAVILDDADLDDFYGIIQRECLPFSGQACFSNTRIIVPRARHDEIVEGIRATLSGLAFGDPSDPETIMGPLVSARQRDRVEAYLHSGKEQGARLVMGGGRAQSFNRGYYIEPTIFTGTTPDMAIFREEIFGPVLCVAAYDSEEEARALHDATDFGLSGSVFSRDVERATEFARHLETGQLLINGRRGAPNAIRDMYKQSAFGGGIDRLAGFLRTKGISQPGEAKEMKTIFG